MEFGRGLCCIPLFIGFILWRRQNQLQFPKALYGVFWRVGNVVGDNTNNGQKDLFCNYKDRKTVLNFSVYLSLLYFIILLTGFVNANAQKAYPFKITVNDSSTMEYQIDTLTKEQFGNSTRTLTKRTVPILYKKKTSTLESLSGIIHLDSCIKIEHKNNSIVAFPFLGHS